MKAQREYRLVIVRPGFPTDISPVRDCRNVWNYARKLRSYWRSRNSEGVRGVYGAVEVREVTPWRPL